MAMVELVKATGATWQEAYEVFFRALRKLMAEKKDEFFGGMDQDRVKASMQDGNEIFLLYRKYDAMPVAAISVLRLQEQKLHEGDLERVKELLQEQEFNLDEIRVLNAIAVRPELWGQGYARNALRQCKDCLKEIHGVKAFIGEYCPDDAATLATMKYVAVENNVLLGRKYIWYIREEKQFLRRRFAFAPSD